MPLKNISAITFIFLFGLFNVDLSANFTLSPCDDPNNVTNFVNQPSDMTISCESWSTFAPETLSYFNNQTGACEISGSVSPSISDNHDSCGGKVTYIWEFTDLCGRYISHTQVVTVEPISEANFVDPPSDITISCDEWSTFAATTLSYSNNQTGACDINGSVSASDAVPLEPCGNDITFTWEFTDLCGRIISHAQKVTVESPLSSNSITKDNIQIYPNPTNDLINIKSEYKITGLMLYTTTGKNLFQSLNTNMNISEIDLSLYPYGLYFLLVETENGRWVEKVIRK